jgi:hypothetical protein
VVSTEGPGSYGADAWLTASADADADARAAGAEVTAVTVGVATVVAADVGAGGTGGSLGEQAARSTAAAAISRAEGLDIGAL